jgi:putative tricarboxylic transport membrane protein
MTDMKKWLRKISSLLTIGISVLIVVSSIQLGIGDLSTPGPGFTAFLVSALALLLSLFVFFKEMVGSRKYHDETTPSLSWKNLVRPTGAMLVLFVFILLLQGFGYRIAAFFLMFGMFFIYNPRKWYYHIFSAAAVAALTFFIFDRWLGVQFPSGDLFPIGW